MKWIDDVRTLTARFISNLLEFQRSKEIEELNEYMSSLRKEAELLKLYFSSNNDQQDTVKDIKKTKNVLSNNHNKNFYIKKFIDHLIDFYSIENYFIKKNNIRKYEEEKVHFWEQFYELEEDADYIEVWNDDAEDVISMPTSREVPEEHLEQASYYLQQIRYYKKQIKKIKMRYKSTKKT